MVRPGCGGEVRCSWWGTPGPVAVVSGAAGAGRGRLSRPPGGSAGPRGADGRARRRRTGRRRAGRGGRRGLTAAHQEYAHRGEQQQKERAAADQQPREPPPSSPAAAGEADGRGGASATARSSLGLSWLESTRQLTDRPFTVPLLSITRPGNVTEISNDMSLRKACCCCGFCCATIPPYFFGSSGNVKRYRSPSRTSFTLSVSNPASGALR